MEDKAINITNRTLNLHIYALDNEKNESDELFEIMEKEYRSGAPGLAITDRNSLKGFYHAYFRSRRYEDFKIIYGMELSVLDGIDVPDNRNIHRTEPNVITILVKTQEGMKNLYHLSTEINLNNSKIEGVGRSLLYQYRSGLLLGSGRANSMLLEALLSNEYNKAEEIAKEAKAGQFISVYLNNKSKILPRPISICGIDKEAGTLRIVYRTVGDGTKELSDYKEGEMVKILGPLGNGFTQKDKKAILIGGGIGIPPMLELMKQLDCDKTAVLGYRDSDMFLKDEFEAVGDVVISTEDGSFGTKGNVIDAIKEQGVEGSIIYACGPTPMLRGIKAYAEEMGIEAQISMEERMACGIGACLACVCKSKDVDSHSHVHNKRVCKDGPVFDAREVEL